MAALRLWFGGPKAEHAPAAASAPERAPAPVVEPELPPEPVNRAIGYVCVPSVSNGELRKQSEAVTAYCESRGLSLASVVHDVESGGREQRPSLAWALEQLANQEAETLVVARLRDLSSNVAKLAPLLSWFNDEGRRLIAIDVDVDTSTEAGRSPPRPSSASAAGSMSGSPSARGAASRPPARAAPPRVGPPSPTSPSCRSASPGCASRA